MPNLQFEYDETKDLLIIEGMKYSGDLFRALSESGLAVGEYLRIIERKDGVVTFETIREPETASAE